MPDHPASAPRLEPAPTLLSRRTLGAPTPVKEGLEASTEEEPPRRDAPGEEAPNQAQPSPATGTQFSTRSDPRLSAASPKTPDGWESDSSAGPTPAELQQMSRGLLQGISGAFGATEPQRTEPQPDAAGGSRLAEATASNGSEFVV
mmetsp:Transcript_29018/g.69728  ORF Transcript_29018/g.69728 Transcript_29018/m.69728 type:complete len:146 (-) Transcript_29018:45-482(-)